MDIHCPSCGEPWDSYHMRYDEPYEWGEPNYRTKDFIDAGSRFNGTDDPMRKAAEAAGWQFASDSVMSFTACPACRGDAILADAIDRKARVAIAALVNGDDDDGLVADLSME